MTKSYTSHRILVPCVKCYISSSLQILYCMQFILKLIKSTNFLLYLIKLNMNYKIQIDLLLTNQNCHIHNMFYTCIFFVLSTHRKLYLPYIEPQCHLGIYSPLSVDLLSHAMLYVYQRMIHVNTIVLVSMFMLNTDTDFGGEYFYLFYYRYRDFVVLG